MTWSIFTSRKRRALIYSRGPQPLSESSNLRHFGPSQRGVKSIQRLGRRGQERFLASYDTQGSPHKELSDQTANDVGMTNPSLQAPPAPIPTRNSNRIAIRKAQESSTHFVCWETVLFFITDSKDKSKYGIRKMQMVNSCFYFNLLVIGKM